MQLNEEQIRHLPDLVTFALIGFALMKADKSQSEWDHPALAAFKPTVIDTLEERRQLNLEKYRREF